MKIARCNESDPNQAFDYVSGVIKPRANHDLCVNFEDRDALVDRKAPVLISACLRSYF